jgi:hypothetical protein
MDDEKDARDLAIASWLLAQGRMTRQRKVRGHLVGEQWAVDANKLLECARELFLQEPGWCSVCDRNRAAPCDFPYCSHGGLS